MADVTVTVNDRKVSVPEGSTILEASIKAGFDVPTFCHSETLKPFTSCFICAVKVEGGKGNLVPSCATKVRDGMKVTVESDEITESRRMCLSLLLSDHCGDCLPPCQDACPANIPIRGFMELTAEGREIEAAALIREKAPLPGILGRICPRPCEDVCRRNRVEEAMSICFMKRHITDREIAEKGAPVLPEPAKDTGKKAAVIGAGPAGMSAAYFLRLQGHSVTIFEAKEQSGGMLRYGIPFYRLPGSVIETEMGSIEKLGVEVKYNTEIGSSLPAKDLEKDFDALILAIGAQGASPMRVPGEDTPGVLSGIDYLDALAKGNPPELGESVVVIGGGNTAIDVARSAVRTGAKVTIAYRRTRKEMPASDFEIDEAIHEGVRMEYLTAPVKIMKTEDARGHDGNFEGTLQVTCTRMELGEPDASGRRRPIPVEGSDFTLGATTVISAIGQKVLPEGISDLGVELTRWGSVHTDERTFMTSRPGIFACGDCQTGADIAVRAVGNGRKAAYAAHQFLLGEEVTGEPVLFNSTMGELEEIDEAVFEGYEKQPRITMPVIDEGERRSTFKEIETGFDIDDARKEAERCLKCGCDGIEDCKLREYATRYQVDQHLFKGESRSFMKDTSHPDVTMEQGKCINCGSCVRACAEIKGLNVFAFVGRGFVTRMNAPFGRSLVNTACDGCGECVKVCPTAALLMKNGKPKGNQKNSMRGFLKGMDTHIERDEDRI